MDVVQISKEVLNIVGYLFAARSQHLQALLVHIHYHRARLANAGEVEVSPALGVRGSLQQQDDVALQFRQCVCVNTSNQVVT